MQKEDGYLLKVFVGESDKHEGRPLYEWIVSKAKEVGIGGATVVRGIEGFGSHHRIHTAKIIDMASDLPLIIELVDSQEKIDALLPILEVAIKEGLTTLTKVEIRHYKTEK